MTIRPAKLPLIMLTLCLLAASALQAQPGKKAPRDTARPAMQPPHIMSGGARGPMTWDQFHHDSAQARLNPHRYRGTNLPRPSSYRGNFSDFQLRVWEGGEWLHVNHAGRLGWWWVIGPDWYPFDAPAIPIPISTPRLVSQSVGGTGAIPMRNIIPM